MLCSLMEARKESSQGRKQVADEVKSSDGRGGALPS